MFRTIIPGLAVIALLSVTGVHEASASASPDTTIECSSVDLTSVLAVKLAMWGAPGLKLRSQLNQDSACGSGRFFSFEFAPMNTPDKYTPRAELRAQSQARLRATSAALGSRSCRVLLRVPLKPQGGYRPDEQVYLLNTTMRVPSNWIDHLGADAILDLTRRNRTTPGMDLRSLRKAASAYFSVMIATRGGRIAVRLDASPEQAKALDADMERGEVFEEITVRIQGGPREDPRWRRHQEQAMREGFFTPPLSLVFEEVRIVSKGVVLGRFLPYAVANK